jgi:hypothetical protein
MPLLTGAAITRRGDALEVVRVLDLEVDHFLNDHRIDSKPVLPFAIALELMAETAAAVAPELEVAELSEIRMLRGIVLERDRVPLRVTARIVERTGERITLSVGIAQREAPERIHYQAAATLEAAWRHDNSGTLSRQDIPEIGVADALPMTVEEAYGDWLFHGPIFQGIASVEAIGSSGAQSLLRKSSPRACIQGAGGSWLIDPVALDSALQVQLLWARMHWDVTLLPLVFRRFRLFAPFGTAAPSTERAGRPRTRIIHHEMRMRPENREPMSHADHYFFDHRGNLMAVVSGAEAAGSKALNRLGRVAVR